MWNDSEPTLALNSEPVQCQRALVNDFPVAYFGGDARHKENALCDSAGSGSGRGDDNVELAPQPSNLETGPSVPQEEQVVTSAPPVRERPLEW